MFVALRRVLGVFLLGFCFSSQASLIQWDAFEVGDGLAVKDESSGLIWLDLSVTAGLSYYEATQRFDDWRLAQYDQVDNLLNQHFSDFTDNSGQGSYINCKAGQTCFEQASQFSTLFGYTPHALAPSFHYSFGLFENANKQLQMGGTVVQNGLRNANIYSSLFAVDYSAFYNAGFYNLSVYLVKELENPTTNANLPTLVVSVDEPSSSLALLLCGGFLLRSRPKFKSA